MTSYFRQTMFERIGLIFVLVVLFGPSRQVLAADPPAKPANRAQADRAQADRAQADRAQADRAQADKARLDLIAKNESWEHTLTGLDQWLSIQTMYDGKLIDEIRKKVMARVAKMSPDQLENFRQNLDAKLVMVLSPEGRDILDWVAANLAAAAPAYRKKMDIQYPDVANLTAAQLRIALDQLAEKRTAAQGQTAALERARQARITGLQAQQRQEAQERQQALNRAPATNGSPYHPTVRQYPDVVSQNQFGWGFGFW